MQDAFLRLWERWDEIGRIEDPTGYLFRVALNGFRMRRLRAAMFIREGGPGPGAPRCVPRYGDARGRAAAPLEVTPRQRAALLLVDLIGYSSEQAERILRARPSTVMVLASWGGLEEGVARRGAYAIQTL